MTSIDLSPIRAEVRSKLSGHRDRLTRSWPGVKSLLEETSTTEFPLTVSLTMINAVEDEDAVVEVSVHDRHGDVVLSAEVLTEGGRMLVPALVQRLPPEPQLQQPTIQSFTGQLDSYLRGAFDALGVPEAPPAVNRRPAAALRGVGVQFEEIAIRWATNIAGTPLNPGKARLQSGSTVSFDFVSSDGAVVGEIKRTTRRTPASALTNPIFTLRKARAKTRLLIIGPSPEPLNRWINTFGRRELGQVQVFLVDDNEQLHPAA